MEGKKTKAVIFDMFGTLVGATSPEQEIIGKFRLPSKKHDGLQRVVCGVNFYKDCKADLESYFALVLEESGLEINPINLKMLRGIYSAEFAKAIPFPETNQILEQLKQQGFKIGLVSNAYPPGRKLVIQERGLAGFFEDSLLSYEFGMTKQNPEIYLLALDRLGVDPKNAIMVGDSYKSDILASKQATKEQIGGILLDPTKNPKYSADRLIVVPDIAGVPKAVREYFERFRGQQ
jgi:HAD superfamily hydrolase (TIGR01549 family)